MKMIFNDNHTEDITFFIYTSSSQPVVLGFPWLQRHNPTVNWVTRQVTFNSGHRKTHCLTSASPPMLVAPVVVEPDAPDMSNVPGCYHDLREIFSKTKATSLPPHRPYDCGTDLLHGTSPPRGRLYYLSAPETEAIGSTSNRTSVQE